MVMQVQTENIPKALRQLDNWVLWRREYRDEKETKVPYQRNGRHAKPNDCETWTNYPAAVSALINGRGKYNGIGFCLSEGTPIGIDLDHCRCPAFPETEIIAPWANDIISKIDSYTEASPSGRGIRIFAYGGKLADHGRNKKLPQYGGDNCSKDAVPAFEIYEEGRYLTVTGNHIAGTPTDIMSRPDIIDAVYKEMFGDAAIDNAKPEIVQPVANMSVGDVLRKAFSSKNGVKIQSLYNGDYSGYGSQSEADLALCSHLAFWLNKDAVAIDMAFRNSGLFRPKWDEKHFSNGQTYGQSVIEKALQSNRETYTGGEARWVETMTQASAWDEPVLFGPIDTPEIPTDLLPGFLGDYCRAVSESTQTPPGLAAMMALSVISTCIQKRFEVSPYEGYTEPLSLWTLAGLEPGARKTAVKHSLTLPLTQWETEQANEMKQDLIKVNHRRDLNQQRINQLKAKASKPDMPSMERESCLNEIFEIETHNPEALFAPRLWTDDVTPEKLQGLLIDHNERMSLISDEGGIFEVMAGLYNNGHSNINVFLQAHAGASVRVDRQGRSVTLHKPALTFGLAVQPQVIYELSQGNKARFRGNGALARFLYCMPKSTVGHRDVTRHITIPETIKTAYQEGIFKLLNIPPVYDEQKREQARILTLHPEALIKWEQFSGYIESKQGEDGEFYGFQDWTSKLPGAALRIAGLFHVIEHGEKTPLIMFDTMEGALDLSELLISHAQAAFDLMGSEQAVSDAKIVFMWLTGLPHDRFTQREALKKHQGRFKRLERLKKALDVLIERHIISTPQTSFGDKGGRPGTYYLINPAIRGGGGYGVA